MLPPDALFPTLCTAALCQQLVRSCEYSAGFCCDVEGSLLHMPPSLWNDGENTAGMSHGIA